MSLIVNHANHASRLIEFAVMVWVFGEFGANGMDLESIDVSNDGSERDWEKEWGRRYLEEVIYVVGTKLVWGCSNDGAVFRMEGVVAVEGEISAPIFEVLFDTSVSILLVLFSRRWLRRSNIRRRW